MRACYKTFPSTQIYFFIFRLGEMRKYTSKPTLKPPGRFLPWGISVLSHCLKINCYTKFILLSSLILATFSISILVLPGPSRQTEMIHSHYPSIKTSQIFFSQKTAPQYFASKQVRLPKLSESDSKVKDFEYGKRKEREEEKKKTAFKILFHTKYQIIKIYLCV